MRRNIFLFLLFLLMLGPELGSFAQTESKQAQNRKVTTALSQTAKGGIPASSQSSGNDDPEDFRLDAAKLKDKRQWTLVNPQPYYISSELDGLCAGPTMAMIISMRKQEPHSNTFISVFVNEMGRDAMFSNPSRKFPEGTIIVKKKFEPFAENPRSAPDQAQATKFAKAPPPPERYAALVTDHFDPYSEKAAEVLLYTVMVKRQPGYNPKVGDWEFAVVSRDGKTEASGKLPNCMSCHMTRPDSDFVFRSYVTIARTMTSK